MNSGQPTIAIAAMLNEQLSQWQQRAELLQSAPATPDNQEDLRVCNRQIARLTAELDQNKAISAALAQQPVYPHSPAFVVPGHEAGLTKRELMAIMAMSGLLSGRGPYNDVQVMSDHIIRHTDALIVALNQ